MAARRRLPLARARARACFNRRPCTAFARRRHRHITGTRPLPARRPHCQWALQPVARCRARPRTMSGRGPARTTTSETHLEHNWSCSRTGRGYGAGCRTWLRRTLLPCTSNLSRTLPRTGSSSRSTQTAYCKLSATNRCQRRGARYQGRGATVAPSPPCSLARAPRPRVQDPAGAALPWACSGVAVSLTACREAVRDARETLRAVVQPAAYLPVPLTSSRCPVHTA
jgi:hypothetical protein